MTEGPRVAPGHPIAADMRGFLAECGGALAQEAGRARGAGR